MLSSDVFKSSVVSGLLSSGVSVMDFTVGFRLDLGYEHKFLDPPTVFMPLGELQTMKTSSLITCTTVKFYVINLCKISRKYSVYVAIIQ